MDNDIGIMVTTKLKKIIDYKNQKGKIKDINIETYNNIRLQLVRSEINNVMTTTKKKHADNCKRKANIFKNI